MRFVIRMAWRELRSSWRRLLFFFICIAIGVESIVALRSIIKNVNRAVVSDARALFTADVRIDTDRPWMNETLDAVNRVATVPLVEGRVETIESPTMLRPADAAREGALMIELKGVEQGYPLVGEFLMTDGHPFDYSLLAGGGTVVSVALLDRLELRVGDRVKIGSSEFEIRGSFEQEPGGGGGFRLGPRVLIERSAVESTGLSGISARARRRIFFKIAEGEMQTFTRLLHAELNRLKDQIIWVRTYRDSEESINENFSRAEDYLSLTGLVILVLGGIGISNVTRVFVDQKKKTIAVLRCVGGSGRRVITIYLAQVMTLGLAGSLLGIALARVALGLVEHYYGDVLPKNTQYSLDTGAVAQGLGVGLLISLLFSALPLLSIRQIRPRLLLRDQTGVPRPRFDLLRWVVGILALVGLLMLVSWQGGSLRVGLFFLGSLAAAALALFVAASILIALVRRIRGISSFSLRQAINSLYRPGNQTRVVTMVVGLGVFLIVAVSSIQTALVREFDLGKYGKLPNMFLIDIQREQREGVSNLVEQFTGEKPLLVPTIRARIGAINGNEIDLENVRTRRERGRLGRDYVATYRLGLEENEEVIAGRFWDASSSNEPEVSVEESLVGLGGLDIGSDVTFDIQELKITAKVTSVRKVDWRNSRTGFLLLFRPGVLDEAPQMLIGAVNGPLGEVERARFQRSVLDQFQNLSIIDVTQIINNVKRIAENVTLAVTFIGGFVLLSGTLILIGSIAMTKFQRIYEAAVLKTLGAKRKTLIRIIVAEYGVIGLIAGIIGSGFGMALSFMAAKYLFEIKWSYSPFLNSTAVLSTVFLVIVVGGLSSFDVLSRKPLSILRGQ